MKEHILLPVALSLHKDCQVAPLPYLKLARPWSSSEGPSEL